MNNDLFSVKAMVPWPLLLEWAAFEVTKDQGHMGKARCCRHGEDRTPSLSWDEEKGFYCHGCSFGGDKIDFVRWIQNCDFKTAKQILYDFAGVVMPHLEPKISSSDSQVNESSSTVNLDIYRLLKSHRAADQLLHQVQVTRLTRELRELEERKLSMGLDKYYSEQQRIELELNNLDEQHIALDFKNKKKIRNYYGKYIRPRNC